MNRHVEHSEDFTKAHVEAENLRYIHPLRTRKWLAARLVSELIDEDKKAKQNDVVKQELGVGVEAVKGATTT